MDRQQERPDGEPLFGDRDYDYDDEHPEEHDDDFLDNHVHVYYEYYHDNYTVEYHIDHGGNTGHDYHNGRYHDHEAGANHYNDSKTVRQHYDPAYYYNNGDPSGGSGDGRGSVRPERGSEQRPDAGGDSPTDSSTLVVGSSNPSRLAGFQE